jgi:calcineurin-binding protein cabin-1
MQLYQFYLPDELPEFDSYRVTSISADVECLLKRVAALVPSHYKPGDIFSICIFSSKKRTM